MSRRSNRTIFLLAFIVLLSLGLLVLVVWMSSHSPQSSVAEPTFPALIQSSADVTIGQPMLVSMKSGQITRFKPGDVMVMIPGGAMELDGYIEIINREPDMYVDSGEPGWSRPIIANIVFKDMDGEPQKNMKFRKPLEICFGMDAETWQEYFPNHTSYQVQRYDMSQDPPKWVDLPKREYADRYQLCGKSSRLSLFGLAINDNHQPIPTPTQVSGP